MRLLNRECQWCKNIFKDEKNTTRKFCSLECRDLKNKRSKQVEYSCQQCGKSFRSGSKSHKKFCSIDCRRIRDEKIWKENNPVLNVASGTVGAVGELRVSVDLLLKGFHVYRAMSQSCPADLAITLNDKLYRVEVTTGNISNNGKIIHPQKDRTKFDILAIVMKTGEIFYEPDINSFLKIQSDDQSCSIKASMTV